MITEEDHPEMIKAQQEVLRRLGLALGDGKNQLTQPFLEKLFGIVKDHRSQCRARGVDFPVLVALVVPRLGIVEFVRADLDIVSLRIKIVNFTRMNPDATMIEIVQALTRAYPDLRPDDILSGHESGTQANQRMVERMVKTVRDEMSKEDDSGDKSS